MWVTIEVASVSTRRLYGMAHAAKVSMCVPRWRLSGNGEELLALLVLLTNDTLVLILNIWWAWNCMWC